MNRSPFLMPVAVLLTSAAMLTAQNIKVGPVDTITSTTGQITFGDENLGTTGKIGAGVASPVAQLDVAGNTYVRAPGILYADRMNSYTGAQFDFTGAAKTRFILSATRQFQCVNGASQPILQVVDSASGAVGIAGISAPGEALDINGNSRATLHIDTSDVRLKRNIADLQGGLDKVLSLRGVTFEWRQDVERSFRTGTQIGFIAQEVEAVVPELVVTSDDGYKSVAYPQITALLVEGMKQQRETIAQQQQTIAQQQQDLTLLKQQMGQLFELLAAQDLPKNQPSLAAAK